MAHFNVHVIANYKDTGTKVYLGTVSSEKRSEVFALAANLIGRPLYNLSCDHDTLRDIHLIHYKDVNLELHNAEVYEYQDEDFEGDFLVPYGYHLQEEFEDIFSICDKDSSYQIVVDHNRVCIDFEDDRPLMALKQIKGCHFAL